MALECWGCGVRHIHILLLIVCGLVETCLLTTVRVSISLVDRDSQNNYTLFDDPYRQIVRTWSDDQKMIMTNSWHVLPFIGSPFSGWLTLKLNLKWFLLAIILMLTAVTYALPHIIIQGGFDAGLTAILFMGIIHGMKDPVVIALLARWIPHTELGRSVSLVFTTQVLSNMITMLLYMFLKESSSAWTSIYYLMGNMGVLWSVGWVTFGAPAPDKCFYVSAKERLYISKNTYTNSTEKKNIIIPWTQLFTSLPFYGVLVPNVCFYWIYLIIFCTNFPQTYVFARNLEYTTTAYLVLLIFLALIPPVQFGTSIIGDLFVKGQKYPTRFVRKTLNSISFWGGCICLMVVCYDTPPWFDVMSLCIFAHVCCSFFQGAILSFFDIDRSISGLIFGVVSFFSLIPTAFINEMTINILKPIKEYRPELDRKFDAIWYVGAISLFFGNFFYIILASDESKPMVSLPTREVPRPTK